MLTGTLDDCLGKALICSSTLKDTIVMDIVMGDATWLSGRPATSASGGCLGSAAVIAGGMVSRLDP